VEKGEKIKSLEKKARFKFWDSFKELFAGHEPGWYVDSRAKANC
jgi:hypothetical protein